MIAPAAVLLLAVAYAKTPAAPTMASTAKAFLDSLYPEQREKATFKIEVDDVIAVLEAGGPRRDPDGYFFSIFGQPSKTGAWGYRIDGHHVSQNFTIVRGKVAGAPSFFGVNPAEVQKYNRKGLRALAREEDLGRDLVQSLLSNSDPQPS